MKVTKLPIALIQSSIETNKRCVLTQPGPVADIDSVAEGIFLYKSMTADLHRFDDVSASEQRLTVLAKHGKTQYSATYHTEQNK